MSKVGVWLVLLTALLPAGCRKRQPIVNESPRSVGLDILRGTIGDLVELSDGGILRVEGYGLVVGLAGTGSRQCPEGPRKYLIQYMGRKGVGSATMHPEDRLSPEQVLQDMRTAPVRVVGEILPGSPVGTRFDVQVSALPGTQTVSLVGGYLLETELRVIRPGTSGTPIAGRIRAVASGPLFVNPFTEDSTRQRPSGGGGVLSGNLLQAVVPGGGEVTEGRELRLSLLTPFYRTADQIQRRINARFPGYPPVADALSAGIIRLRVPSRYKNQVEQFLSLVMHLYLRDEAAFVDAKLRELSMQVLEKDAPYERISLLWEGIGRPALRFLQRLYASDNEAARFYAVRTGAKLGDFAAVELLADFAKRDGPYQELAVTALGRFRPSSTVLSALRPLLSSSNTRLRLAAYRALRRMGDVTIRPLKLNGAFEADVVDCHGNYLIYVMRYGHPRLVIFGADMRCRTPLFYQSSDGLLLLSAEQRDGRIGAARRLLKRGPMTKMLYTASTRVADLISLLGGEPRLRNGILAGLGMDYTHVVAMLYQLCSDKTIPAEFIIERPAVGRLLVGPQGRRTNRRPGKPR